MSNKKIYFNFSQIVYFFLCTYNFKNDILISGWESIIKNFNKKGGITMKNYVKPDFELKAVTAKDVMASGLKGWLADSNLSDVGITTAELYILQS